MIEVSEQTLDRMHTLLAGIQDADQKVLKPAFTRGLMAGKTEAGKVVRKTYHISPADFKDRGFLKYNAVTESGSGIIGSLVYSGAVIPLIKFKVNPDTPKNQKTPSAAVLRSSGLVSFSNKKNVFVAQMKSGHIGVFERQDNKYSKKRGSGRNKHTEALKELLSPAVPQMVGNEIVMQTVEERVNEVINNRINHEIDRLLDKQGGK